MPQAVKKILLVDDDDDLREALGEQLIMTEEFDVFEAGNGQEAIGQGRPVRSDDPGCRPARY